MSASLDGVNKARGRRARSCELYCYTIASTAIVTVISVDEDAAVPGARKAAMNDLLSVFVNDGVGFDSRGSKRAKRWKCCMSPAEVKMTLPR